MVTDIINGLVLLLSTEVTGVTASNSYPRGAIQDEDLPFCVVSSGRASYTRIDNYRYKVTRIFYVDTFVVRTTSSEREFLEELYNPAALAILDSIPDYFISKPHRLSAIVPGVKSTDLTTDDSIGAAGWDSFTYRGTRFNIVVEYIRKVGG